MGQPVDYDQLAKQSGAQGSAVDYDQLAAQAGATSSTAPLPVNHPSFWSQPKEYLAQRAQEMGDSAKAQMDQAVGPESQGKSVLSRLGHSALSYLPATAQVIDKAAAGLMGWDGAKNAAVMATGAIDPAIPAAYYATQGTSSLTGIGQPGQGQIQNTIQRPTPENVQDTLLSAATVAGSAAAATSPRAGTVVNPKPVLSRPLLLGRTPSEAYQSALKPSTTLSQDERAAVVSTGLQNRIPISQGGLERISGLIDDLNNRVDATIASNPNAPIDPQAVATRVDQIKPRFANQVNASQDLSALDASKQQFLTERGAKPGTPAVPPQPLNLLDSDGKPIMSAGTPAQPPKPAPPMTAEAAQAMKKGTYQNIGDKAYGEIGTASVEAQKALARGLREELLVQFPELKNLNGAESQLLDLQPQLERAVNRIGNHQLIGLGTPVATGAAKVLTGSTKFAAAVGVMKAVLDNPVIKSKLAISLYKSGQGRITPAVSAARVQGYINALGAAQSQTGDDTQ